MLLLATQLFIYFFSPALFLFNVLSLLFFGGFLFFLSLYRNDDGDDEKL